MVDLQPINNDSYQGIDSIVSALEEQQGMLFMLVGPGGVGKNALMQDVLGRFPYISQLATATTRKPRGNEQDGVHHLFVTLEEFQRMLNENELLEHQEVTPGKFYGVPRAILESAFSEGRVLIADVEYLGADILKRAYPDNAMTVFIAPPSREALIERMTERQDDPVTIQQRMERMIEEMHYAPSCDFLVVNDDKAVAVDELCSVIDANFIKKAAAQFVNQVSYEIEVWPVYENSVLVRDGVLPRWRIQHTREPLDQVALKVVQDALGAEGEILASKLDYGISGDAYSVDINYSRARCKYQLIYHYTYRLSERISPPPDWSWRALDELQS